MNLLRIWLLTLFACWLTGCGQPKQELNVFIWSEYLAPEIIKDFERQFDCVVNVDFYEDPDSMIAKLAGGGTSLYDIVVPSDTAVPGMIKRGLLAPLRHENIPNLKHVDPRFTNAPHDPGNRYSVPLDWGSTGIYIRAPKDQPVEPTWGLFFDPAKQPGPFLLMDDIRACVGAALKFKGYSLNSTNIQQLIEVRELLIQAKQRSLGFEGGAGCKNRVLSRGAVLAVVYNGDGERGAREDPETRFIHPREGGQLWIDVISVPAQAPHRDLAEQFINYLLDPKVSARFVSYNQFATANLAAMEFLSPADAQNATIYPPTEVMDQLEFAHDLGAMNQLYDELWTRVKSE